MKKDTHPTYYPEAKVVCACGNTFTTGSTRKEIKVEVCAACHPFFTGELKFVDTEGRVDKFIRKRNEAEVELKKRKALKEAKEKRKQAEKTSTQPKSLKELYEEEEKSATSPSDTSTPKTETIETKQ